jgi:TatD DNase family protein
LANRPGVLHSFSADEEVAEKALEINFRIGITGPVTFSNAKNIQRIVKMIPLANLLIETDAPFLSPQPKRGRRNAPAYVRYIAKKIAELKEIPFEEVARQTTENAKLLFQIGEKTLA